VWGSNIQFFNVDAGKSGSKIMKQWIPTKDEIEKANDVYVDASKKAVFKVGKGINSGLYELVIDN